MNGTDYYLFNAHGDVTGLADSTGASARAYDYDAFGVEKDPDPLDENPFRYCGEYFDRETETYYLRARYYDPTIGRFTQQDTHWTTANSIYGDNPQKINEREDKLGLKSYSYAPQITAVMQSGNLYVYGIGNPVLYADANGAWIHLVIGAIAGAIVSGVVSGAAQYATSGKIDFWRILIAMGSGAVSGLLAATGVGLAGQIAGNALISSVANLGDQLYLNRPRSATPQKTGSHKRKAIIAPLQPAENEAQKRPQSLGQVHQDQSHPNDAEGRLLQMCGNAA